MQWKQFKREITRTKIICQIDFKPKGQLISKSLLVSSILPKTNEKKSTLLLWYLKSNSFRLFFGRIEDTKKDISKLTDL